ncbi:MAG TPA: alpha/beta hydrolase-fold protein [Polyangia bacterium]|nr:alpha/beta hydrolase-fold protein [Polyangia bacterium]
MFADGACGVALIAACLSFACSAGSVGGGGGGTNGGTGGITAGGAGGTITGTGGGGGDVGGGSGGGPGSGMDAAPVDDHDGGGNPDTTATEGGADASVESSATDPGTEGDGVREIGPSYSDATEISAHGAPKGKTISFIMKMGSSKIYPKAIDRAVTVYVPTQYVAGTPAPVIVAQDGTNFFDFVTLLSNTLDNFISAKKLPPIVAVYAGNGGGDAQGSERGLEYDTVSGVYAEWVDQELLPRVEMETKTQAKTQAVTFTHDPEGRGALGGSSGGIASFSMMWWHPDLFRRAVIYSGSFVAQEFPINPDHPLGGWNYHEDKDNDAGGIIAKTDPIKPIRAWLECGSQDNDVGSTQYPHYDFQFAGQHMELKLAAKGYHVHLDHGNGAGHVDSRVVRQTLPEAILWAWRGYAPK